MMSRTSSPPQRRTPLRRYLQRCLPKRRSPRDDIRRPACSRASPKSGLPAKILAGAISNLEQKVTVRNLNFYYGDSLALKNVSLPYVRKR